MLDSNHDSEVQREASQLVGWQPRIAHGASVRRSATAKDPVEDSDSKELIMSESSTNRQAKVSSPAYHCSCQKFHAGYEVHHIQARLARELNDWQPVSRLSSEGNFIELGVANQSLEKWNHNPALVEYAVHFFKQSQHDSSKISIEYSDRYSLLSLTQGRQRRLISLAHVKAGLPVWRRPASLEKEAS